MRFRGLPLLITFTCRCRELSWTTSRAVQRCGHRCGCPRRSSTKVESYVCRPDPRGGKDDNKGAYRQHQSRSQVHCYCKSQRAAKGASVHNNVTAFLAMGTYVALELRVRGCVVIHGSSFWSKMACHLKPSVNYHQMLSWDASGNGDERQMVHRGWAI